MSDKDNYTNEPLLYLASSSPRRKELLSEIGVQFEVISQSVDESLKIEESPASYVMRLAQNKAEAGRDVLPGENLVPVLGADTIVVCQGEILGKPVNEADAKRMLSLLSGQWHEVLTAVCLTNGNKSKIITSKSRVKFRTLSEEEIELYWLSGEPQDKAGSYAIQGLGGIFVERLEGSYSGVVGLPIYETAELLKTFEITIKNLIAENRQ